MRRYALPDPSLIFPRLVARAAAERPDETFVYSVGEGEMTNLELDVEARNWSSRFSQLGVGPGTVVATLCRSGLPSLAWWIALTRAGAVEVSVNTEYHGRMLAHALGNALPTLIIAEAAHLPALDAIAAELSTVKHVLVPDGDEELESRHFNVVRVQSLAADPTWSGALPEAHWHDIACVQYTSGTTGPSKAIKMPWAQLHAALCGIVPEGELGPADIIYGVSPSCHWGAKAFPYWAALIGGKVVLRDRFSLADFWSDIERYQVTTAGLVGSMAEVLYRSPDGPGPETTLRNVGMVPMIPDYENFNERFGTRIYSMYNTSEMSIPINTSWNPSNWRAAGKAREGYPGYELRLVDEYDQDVPDGEVGELIVRTDVPWTLNAGYLNMPEATATAWRNGWYHTGDGLRRGPDGGYEFVDRFKDAIRRRGENISSFEVEALVAAHRGVKECAAVAVPAETGEDEIMVFVVPDPTHEVGPDRLVRDLVDTMPRFMVPRYVEYVDELPRTRGTFKVRKVELRQRGVGPATWDRVAAGVAIPNKRGRG